MTATIARSEYERMQRIAEDQHEKHMAALLEVDRLRAVMQSILDDADMAYYERRQGDWFLLRLKQALDNGSEGPRS